MKYVKIQLTTNGLTHYKYYRKLVERSFIHSSIINCYLYCARHYIFFVDSSLGLWPIYTIFYLKSPCIDLTGISNMTCLTVNLDSLANLLQASPFEWQLSLLAVQAKNKTTTKNPVAAAAAKSLQSCPTLCDPIDSSLPGSSVPGILQARILE